MKKIASKIAPNPSECTYWIDLTADKYGSIIKSYNGKEWVPINKGEDDVQSSDIKELKEKVNQVETQVNEIDSNYVSKYMLTEYFAYGIEYDTTVSSHKCTRIGNLNLHRELPIQSKMRRCLLLDDGRVNYYLSNNDSTKKEDGTDANLTGADGQVMVEIPQHYRKFETVGTKIRCLISETNLEGYTEVPKAYISAYEASLDKTTSTYKLSSVVNNTAAFRGGNDNAEWDGTYRSLLGMPYTNNTSLTNFRKYARNRGSINWNCSVYEVRKTICWLYLVEYADFHSQDYYKSQLTVDGYRQGGLGKGVTYLSGSTLSGYNSWNPIITCGYTNSLGNNTGIKTYTLPTEYDTTKTVTTDVISYRGIENVFGHMNELLDGCKLRPAIFNTDEKDSFYVCENPTNYQDKDSTNYVLRGICPKDAGYIKALIVGEYGEIAPAKVQGGTNEYMCDYYQPGSYPNKEEWRDVRVSGYMSSTDNAGMFYMRTAGVDMTYEYNIMGTRLCYITKL